MSGLSNRQSLLHLGRDVKTYLLLLISYNIMCITKAADPENMIGKKPIHIDDLFSINGNLRLGGGYLSNNQYGENGYYTTISFQPQIAIKGVPIDLSWNVVKPPQGALQFGHFNIGFSKQNFQRFLEDQKANSFVNANVDSLMNFEEVKAKLSEMDYLQTVSESSKEYKILQKDSLSGAFSATNEIRMDSLRQVVSEYETLNRRFHELKVLGNQGSVKNLGKDSTQMEISGTQRKIKNDKGEAKAISDSLKMLEDINHLTKLQQTFMRFDKISLGYDVLDFSKLSVVGYPYIGGAADYSYRGVITGFAVGKHVPYYSSINGGIFSNEFANDADMLHFKLGVGDSENSSILSVVDFSKQTHIANMNSTSESDHERVWTILSEKKLGDNANFQFEISKSSTPDDDSESGKLLNDIAFSALTSHELPQLNTKVKFEYQNIGAGFHTPGNPYLSKGFQLLSFGLNKSILKGKLSGELNVIQSWKTPGIEMAADWKRLSISVAMKAKISKTVQTSFRRYTNRYFIGDKLNGGEQKTQSNQVSVSFIPGKKITITITGLAGRSERNSLVYSRNYLGTSSISMKHNKGALTLQANHYVTVTSSELRNTSVTIGDRFLLSKRLNIRLSVGANLNESTMTSILNYGFGYSIAKRLMFDLSGSYNSFYSNDGLVPVYSRYQAQCGFNFSF